MGTKEHVGIGFVGLGSRGKGLLKTLLGIDAVRVVALCDLEREPMDEAAALVETERGEKPYCDTEFDALLARPGVDAVIIATDWAPHIPLAIRAMRARKATAVEVAGAFSVRQCWDLVGAYHETGVHCMMLENCCYGRNEMALLRMTREGVLGEIIHCRGAYGHDLRASLTDRLEKRIDRTRNYMHRCSENYPTHELGPMAKILGLNRGNRMLTLASMASKARGINAWALENRGPEHPLARYPMAQGDVVTTMIRCAGGETMLLTLDTSLPRPYSRGGVVQGTRGLWQEDGQLLYIEGSSPEHEWESFEARRDEFEHPLWRQYLSDGVRSGHGGMDYLALSAFVDSVQRGCPPPIDTYDTASWMAVAALSEDSIALGGQPVAVPDFTGGLWMVREPGTPGRYALDV